MSRPPKRISDEEKKSTDEVFPSIKHSYSPPHHCLIASSQAETLLLSSSGDVLTSRCRLCPYPSGSVPGSTYRWQDDIVALCCDADNSDDLSTQVQSSSNLCAPWGHTRQKSYGGDMKNSNHNSHSTTRSQGGLLGGAPAADVATSHYDHLSTRTGRDDGHSALPALKCVQESESYLGSCAHNASGTPPLDMNGTVAGFQADSILPVRSFDHSLYTSPPRRLEHIPKVQTIAEKENIQQFVHGIPTFSCDFASIKVKTISAHPLGSHVLLISNAGLLYAYGLNHFGQLGIGLQSDVRGPHRGYVMTPSIVTPLVENGGKAIACAAGLSHSLVVVETQERRLVKKSRSFEGLLNGRDEDEHSTEVVHHQVYGFGRNDYMKIGLVGPRVSHRHRSTTASAGSKTAPNTDDMECVVVPRRVALHASFHQSDTNSETQCGIFSIAAGAQHSAALVRKQSGDVEMYSWGNSTHGALGLPSPSSPKQQQQNHSQQFHPHHHIVPVPTFVEYLSHTPSNPGLTPQSLLMNDEFPVTLSLSKTCSFVVTSLGRCFAFGSSAEGMLGLGRAVKETHQPNEILLPLEALDERFVSISAGACHVLATCDSGAVYAWGAGRYAGLVEPATNSPEPKPTTKGKPATTPSPKPQQQHFEWCPKRVIMPYEYDQYHCRSGAPQPAPVAQATAGFDCSLFLSHSGCVYASGKSSGRLGLGELSEALVVVPRPLFGGLHLWKRDENRSYGNKRIEPLPQLVVPRIPARKVLTRGLTLA